MVAATLKTLPATAAGESDTVESFPPHSAPVARVRFGDAGSLRIAENCVKFPFIRRDKQNYRDGLKALALSLAFARQIH